MARRFTIPQLAPTDRPADDEAARRVAELNLASAYVARHATDLDDQREPFAMLGLSGEYVYKTAPVSPEYTARPSEGGRRAS